MDFIFKKILSVFGTENWLWKHDFGTIWWTINHRKIVLKQFPLSMSILGQKSCILGPTILIIPQPNWQWYAGHYQMRFVYLLPTVWRPFLCFQGDFWENSVHMYGQYSRAGYDGAHTVFGIPAPSMLGGDWIVKWQ